MQQYNQGPLTAKQHGFFISRFHLLSNFMSAVEKDAHKGMGSGWERFEFDKDAPLDDDEIEGLFLFPCGPL